MKKRLLLMVSTVALATGAILDQGCSSLGELPKGMVWYKAGASAWQTEYDWNMCQLQELHVTSPQPLTTASQANFTTPNYPPTTVQPDAYGLGVNSDQYGRATTYQLQNGQQLDPIFNGSVKQNAYGPGVGMDQFGRPIYNAPYVDTGRQPTYNAPNDNSVGGQIALNLLVEMTQNHRAKTAMIAKGYALVNKDEMSKSFQNLKVKAEGGNADAEYRLSLCYANNYGVEQNWEEFVNWVRKAAEQGLPVAQFCMGNSYWCGVGVQRDDTEACKWFALAAAQGNENAKTKLGIINFFKNADEVPELDPIINKKLLGHWSVNHSKKNTIRGQCDIYFLPQNRVKIFANLIDKTGQALPSNSQIGRYFFSGNQLFTCGDNDKDISAPQIFSVTDTQLTLENFAVFSKLK